MVPRVDTTPHRVETPTWDSQSQDHPGIIRSYPLLKSSIHLQLQQTGDESGGPPG